MHGATSSDEAALVRQARTQSGLTQTEFAARLRSTQPKISRYESGKVRPPAAVLMQCRHIISEKGDTPSGAPGASPSPSPKGESSPPSEARSAQESRGAETGRDKPGRSSPSVRQSLVAEIHALHQAIEHLASEIASLQSKNLNP